MSRLTVKTLSRSIRSFDTEVELLHGIHAALDGKASCTQNDTVLIRRHSIAHQSLCAKGILPCDVIAESILIPAESDSITTPESKLVLIDLDYACVGVKDEETSIMTVDPLYPNKDKDVKKTLKDESEAQHAAIMTVSIPGILALSRFESDQ